MALIREKEVLKNRERVERIGLIGPINLDNRIVLRAETSNNFDCHS